MPRQKSAARCARMKRYTCVTRRNC
jgi:hypothetical protein